MAATEQTLSKKTGISGWNVFWLITIPTSLAVIVAMTTADLSGALGVSSMIQFSVRCSVPWLYIAFAASSLAVLLPGSFSRWLLRNRRYIGVSYAAAMGWQLTFILWLLIGHWDYYIEEVYLLSDVVIQVPGYILLFAMTLTSFQRWRIKLSARQWRILHKGSIYFLWATVWTTYWYELYYYDDIQLIDYIFYWTGLAAWGLRVLAWGKKTVARRAAA